MEAIKRYTINYRTAERAFVQKDSEYPYIATALKSVDAAKVVSSNVPTVILCTAFDELLGRVRRWFEIGTVTITLGLDDPLRAASDLLTYFSNTTLQTYLASQKK